MQVLGDVEVMVSHPEAPMLGRPHFSIANASGCQNSTCEQVYMAKHE